ncbi:MAG TPA: hypothetical protein PLO37_01405 [Candidatus Hydrogenedentes bacterium]|nr:hypothetical protein [Candidatus Hydrogenedentota bacterium]HPG65473.1 hypothetical protein [Candidatus Hydrogenedentota bacterium]
MAHINALSLTSLIATVLVAAAPPGQPLEPPLWKPVADDVFLQEVGTRIATDAPAVAVAVFGDKAYVCLANGMAVIEEDTLVPIDAPAGTVRKLKAAGDALWLITDSAIHRFDGAQWGIVGQGDFVDLCDHAGQVIVADCSALYRVADEQVIPMEDAPKSHEPITHIASYAETIYALADGKIRFLNPSREKWEEGVEWGDMPSVTTRDLLALGSRLLVATDKGLAVLRGTGLTTLTGKDGLCYEDTTCLAPGFDGDLWIGTSQGAIRSVGGEYHYFAADRWLPNNAVNAVACGDRVAYVATNGGLGIIRYEPYTLLKKAAYYERHLEEWGQKRIGFTHKLEWNPEKSGWVREVSDNDVGWSSHYLCAQCFKYAVTGDQAARDEAKDFFYSMKLSEEMSSIPGFPARSIWAVGETGNKAQGGSGGYPAEWHPTPDGQFEWKADTSSDETDAHYYASAIYYELAADDTEKARVRDHLSRISDHIIREGWVLRDLDGKPTRWARWDPAYFKAIPGCFAKGLNGLEILSYMRTAAAITGNPAYEDAYGTLLGYGYHNYVINQKHVTKDSTNHSDDRLAFYAFYPLLKYETDPALRSLYRRSLERSWEIERIEHIPWFSFIYGALTGNDCETEQATTHLREWPLDMVAYRYKNSIRTDLATPPGYVPYCDGTRAISPRERGPLRWSSSTLGCDGGNPNSVVDPSGWLEAYWMGRYYGFIEAPTATDPVLITVEHRSLHLGAVPYDGPPRPPLAPLQP